MLVFFKIRVLRDPVPSRVRDLTRDPFHPVRDLVHDPCHVQLGHYRSGSQSRDPARVLCEIPDHSVLFDLDLAFLPPFPFCGILILVDISPSASTSPSQAEVKRGIALL